MRRSAGRGWIAPAAIVLVALALRAAYFMQIRENPFFLSPVFDARDYQVWAEEIAGGQLLWDELRLHSPGYPYALALISVLTDGRLPAMVFANSLLACAWILLLTLALRRLLPRPAPEIAGGLAAVYWVFLPFEAQLLAETWFSFQCVLALYVLVRARSWRGLAVAGAVLGLAATTRPNAVACLPFVMLAAARGSSRPEALRRAGAIAAAFAVVYSPVLIRNHQVSGVLATRHHMAINLYMGNRAGAPGFVDPRPGPDWDALSAAPERLGGARTLSDHERWFADRVREDALADPAGLFRLQLRKLALFLSAQELRVILSPHFFEEWAPLQASPPLPGFGAMIPFAVVGLAVAWRRGGRIGLLYAFALPLSASVIATMIGSRYRLPAVPFLIAFAGAGAAQLLAWARVRRWPALGAGVAAAAAVALVAHRPVPDSGGETFAEEWTHVATARERDGDPAAARAAYERALQEDPARAATYSAASEFALRIGDLGAAAGLGAAGLELRPGDPALLAARGRALLLAGQADSAAACLEELARIRPEDADVRADLARALYDLGRADESIAAFRESLRAAPEAVGVLIDASGVLLETGEARGDPDLLREGRELLRRAADRSPSE